MKNIENRVLGIMGAGGLAREVYELALIVNRKSRRWNKFVFIDKNNTNEVINGCCVLSYDSAKSEYGNSLEVVMGIGEPAIREKLYHDVISDGIPTPTLIHPDVYIPKSTSIGTGVTIQYGCFVSCNVIIGNYVFLQPQCNIGHDDVIEEGCMIAGFSNLGGIVHIGRYSYLGLSSVIKQAVSIGNYSIVGMGSVVYKDIPDEVIAIGNPARIIANNTEKKVFGH